MHKVTSRTWIVWVFLAFLLGGLGFFLVEYALEADQWASFQGSPHIYEGGELADGVIYDRQGEKLLWFENGRHYSEDPVTRASTLHWLGDSRKNIRGTMLDTYAAKMYNYDKINGLHDQATREDGGKIRLTLSAQVQNAAYKAMNGRKGTVSVYNYKTGEILCAVTTPSFDPLSPPDITADPEKWEGVYLNRFVQSVYPPGSIFKIATTAAALDTIPDIEEQTFTCNGRRQYKVGGEVTCERAHGTQNLKTALANSCNCAFAQIAEQLGKDNMEKYIRKFHLTEPVSFDGYVSPKGHYDLSEAISIELAWSSIGQYTDLISPARYLSFVGAVAGGGRGAEPHLVSEVWAGNQRTYEGKTQMGPRIMDEELALKLQQYLHNNVQTVYGPGNFPGFRTVCGKSGTSELGGGQKPNAMFAGFILDEEYPLAFMAVIENAGYGSANCVPVLSQVLTACRQVMDC